MHQKNQNLLKINQKKNPQAKPYHFQSVESWPGQAFSIYVTKRLYWAFVGDLILS